MNVWHKIEIGLVLVFLLVWALLTVRWFFDNKVRFKKEMRQLSEGLWYLRDLRDRVVEYMKSGEMDRNAVLYNPHFEKLDGLAGSMSVVAKRGLVRDETEFLIGELDAGRRTYPMAVVLRIDELVRVLIEEFPEEHKAITKARGPWDFELQKEEKTYDNETKKRCT